MRVAFDIGGVISKYPAECRLMIEAFRRVGAEVHVITDQHDRDEIARTLARNGFEFGADRIHPADYARYGDACKAVLLRDLGIDVFYDDHPGYLVWPWPTPAPMRLRVEPDPRQPYWHAAWACDGGEFGRRCFMEALTPPAAGPPAS